MTSPWIATGPSTWPEVVRKRGRPRQFDAEEARERHRKAALEHYHRVAKARRAQKRQEVSQCL